VQVKNTNILKSNNTKKKILQVVVIGIIIIIIIRQQTMHRVNKNNNKTINKSQVINDMHTHTHNSGTHLILNKKKIKPNKEKIYRFSRLGRFNCINTGSVITAAVTS